MVGSWGAQSSPGADPAPPSMRLPRPPASPHPEGPSSSCPCCGEKWGEPEAGGQAGGEERVPQAPNLVTTGIAVCPLLEQQHPQTHNPAPPPALQQGLCWPGAQLNPAPH